MVFFAITIATSTLRRRPPAGSFAAYALELPLTQVEVVSLQRYSSKNGQSTHRTATRLMMPCVYV